MRLVVAIVVILLTFPQVARAHISMSWWQATSGTTWIENDVVLTSSYTTDAGQTTSPVAFSMGTWVQGGDHLLTDASTNNWHLFEVQGFDYFTPLTFNIVSKSGVQEIHASTGAVVTVSGAVGSVFTFPTTIDWANLDWIAVHTVSGSLGMDDLLLSLCPHPLIAGPYTVSEGSAFQLGASVEGTNQQYNWDLDGDGLYDDATAAQPLFSAASLDGPSTVTIGLEASANCGVVGVQTMTDDEVVTVTNVAPTITPPTTPTTADEGDALSWTMSFVDPGATDTHTLLFDYGDGTTQSGVLTGTHSYADEGNYTLTMTVTDDDGGGDTETLSVFVANAPPSIDGYSIPSTAVEGEFLTFTSTSTDPGLNDVVTSSWSFGDGSGSHAGANHGHSYFQEGTYTVVLTVEDDDGGASTATGSVVVSDVPPAITTFSVPATADEGDTISVTGAAFDPGADVLTYTWDWGDGTPTSNGPTPTHTFGDEGSYTVTLTVSDQSGVAVSQSSIVAVANVAPTITGSSIPSGPEGSPLTFSASVVEPGADTLNAVWDLGDGTFLTGTTVSHAYADEGVYSVSFTVDDGDGGNASLSGTSTVVNVAPTIDSLSGNTTGPEGATLGWTAVVSDPGTTDVVTYSWNFGDGTTATGGPTQSHAYASDGSYIIVLVVDDGDGGTNAAVLNVVVSNDIPLITSMTAPDGDEAQSLSFSATAVDPGNDPVTYSWDFGDGSPTHPGASVTHTYADDGTYTVLLTVTDSQNAQATQTDAVQIANLPPTLDPVVGPATGAEGSTLSWSATSTDPSTLDPPTYTWQWGDGSSNGTGAAASHTYADDGTYTMVVTVEDGDGGADTETLTIGVTNVAPSIDAPGPATAVEGLPYTFTPVVMEPGPDVLVFALVGPATMTLDTNTGALNWTPTYADAGTNPHAVTLSVDDGDGGTDQVSWDVTVSWADDDQDGMPDTWEIANDLDPTDPTDAAADGDGDGVSNLDEFLGDSDPGGFDGPDAPPLLSPEDGSETDARPELEVGPAVDPQGDPLVLTIEVYGDDALTTVLASSSVAQTEAGMTWTVDVDLPENADAWWRARASDPFASGPWSEARRLFVNATEEAPPAPTLLFPVGGELVGVTFPSLEWAEVEDPDGDAITYGLILRDDEGEVTRADSLPGGFGAFFSWEVDVELTEDVAYTWTVETTDDTGLAGGPSEPAEFFYSRTNAGPVGVAFITPEDGAALDDRSPLLEADEGSDPEGDVIGYLFEVAGTPSFDDASYAGREVAATGTGIVTWDLAEDGVELPYGEVYGRVRGVDAGGANSQPDSVAWFVPGGVEPTPEPTPGPTDSCADCEASLAGGSGEGLPVFLTLLGVILACIRRSSRPESP